MCLCVSVRVILLRSMTVLCRLGFVCVGVYEWFVCVGVYECVSA